MMTVQIIPVFSGSIDNESVLLCNARDLHKFLSIGKVFAAWITSRISEYGFIENQDYVLLSRIGKQTSGRGGHNRKDYHLTLDTAKELAMVERNEKGRQIRRYFIECEKRLHSPIKTESLLPSKDKPSQELMDLYHLNAISIYFDYINEVFQHQIRPGLTLMDSPIPAKLCDRFTDGSIFIAKLRASLEKRAGCDMSQADKIIMQKF